MLKVIKITLFHSTFNKIQFLGIIKTDILQMSTKASFKRIFIDWYIDIYYFNYEILKHRC